MSIKSVKQGRILYFDPKTIAEYDPDMMGNKQGYSHKTYMIKFAYCILNGKSLDDTQLGYLDSIKSDYPELSQEINTIAKERFDLCLS